MPTADEYLSDPNLQTGVYETSDDPPMFLGFFRFESGGHSAIVTSSAGGAYREVKKSIQAHRKFWREYVRQGERTDDGKPILRIDGTLYLACPESNGLMRGFAGRRFRWRMGGSEDVFTTNNLWQVGVIPEEFRTELPNNAEWVKA